MATYAIGDIQGCYRTFKRLLKQVGFEAGRDRLWLVGDLVNRGPRSDKVLRWMVRNDAAVTAVMGNHDLLLLACAAGLVSRRRRDTLGEVLRAPDSAELIEWLARRPLLHREGGYTLVHAGLLPQWRTTELRGMAHRVEVLLRGPGRQAVLERMLAGLPHAASECHDHLDDAALTIAGMTILRTCTADGRMHFAHKGPPEAAPRGYYPWFEVPGRNGVDTTVVFGHWAALGLLIAPGVIALDTGCVWGRKLTAYRLEDGLIFQEPRAD
jgi:bis(5'-nucleosyl)-tetraphosphatase (symmetrical)